MIVIYQQTNYIVCTRVPNRIHCSLVFEHSNNEALQNDLRSSLAKDVIGPFLVFTDPVSYCYRVGMDSGYSRR